MDLRNTRMIRAKELQEKMNKIIEKLQNEHAYTLGEPLVDEEGYPRNDIDVYLVSKLLAEYKGILKEWKPLRKMVEEDVFNTLRADREE
ncbi:hypothetical protein NEMIN01_1782 [Nematocida minor]|uniref:uncharacterized protein n=1 Tax=Nematocida minor TaxID=1912983 RepID=UPI00221FD2C9|nr:uncharacterized protein NEMIN01_1782 [Nematocida minor]KAI5192034.1 hypothetical protein NEMIN01_1782 [Nematocida minor]